MDRYSLLIDLGNELPELPEDKRTDQNLIDGCQSKVWIDAKVEDGKIQLQGDSDAILVKGIVALVIKVLSNNTPQEILNADLYFIAQTGLQEHLSPTRSNGLLAMIKQIKMYALAYQAKSAQ